MFYNIQQQSNYPADYTQPMIDELTEVGFESVPNPSEVEKKIDGKGTTFVLVNSVCGCGARNARPGAILAKMHGNKMPDNMITVFAGVDIAATEKAREFFLPYPPSSPCMALFKDGQLVYFLERRDILGLDANDIAHNLIHKFNEVC